MDLARTQSDDAMIEPAGQAVSYCRYCGSPLNAQFYFCTSCSTPYAHSESVLPNVDPIYESEGTLINRRAPSAMPVFWTYFSVLVGGGIVSYAAFGPDDIGKQMVLGTVLIGLTTCIVAAIYWRSLVVQFKRFGFDNPAAWIGVAILVPLLALNHGYHDLFLRRFGVPMEPLDAQWSKWATILMICVLPAITEEIAFRGLVQHWLQAALTPLRAVVIASAMFAAIHFTIISFPYLFLVGMLLGWTKLKTQSLYPSMLIHFLHNLIVIEFMSSVH